MAKLNKKFMAKDLFEEKPKEFWAVTYVSRDDIKGRGYDVSKLTDDDMEQFAYKMGNAICDGDYWPVLDCVAKWFELKKIKKIK
jgi:hypothetical protein